MIIQVEGAESLAEYCSNPDSFVMEVPKQCEQCWGVLWRHGKYKRKVKDLGKEVVLWVPRLLCSICRISYSCLFSFIVPFKRYEASVLREYVEEYMQDEGSYRDVAWGAEDGEKEDAEASVSRAFRAVDEARKIGKKLVSKLQEEAVEQGANLLLDASAEFELANARKARSAEKARGLGLLAYCLRLTKRFKLQSQGWISSTYHRHHLEFRKSTPQSLQQAIF